MDPLGSRTLAVAASAEAARQATDYLEVSITSGSFWAPFMRDLVFFVNLGCP